VYADFVMVVSTHPLLSSHEGESQDYSGKRRFERERGICIQRSKAAPPKGKEGEEEGEEEEELEIPRVLIQKEIQARLGSIVIQRFEYFVLCFGALML
ncbi:hypothetical protein Taro_055705, partial [Colocasia esculenta]|nr:hypothetical protein [Colocasia esculenta]